MNATYLVEECSAISIGSIKKDPRFEYKDGDESIFFYDSEGLSQQILISEQAITFGVRRYFVCDCGVRVNKLFLPPGMRGYKCRNCYKLRYELTTINPRSIHGKLMYRTNRMIKLTNKRTDLNRIFYKGRYTKRFNRFLHLCARAGLVEVVENASKLTAAVASL